MIQSTAKLSRLDPASLANNERATLRSWMRYKPLVDAAIAIFPKPYVFTPITLAPNTAVTQVRDAIRGAIAFAYEESTKPGYTRTLRNWYSQIVVRPSGKTIVIGPPSKELSALEVEGTNSGSTNALSFSYLSVAELSAFCTLLSGNRINGPIIIRNPPDLSHVPVLPNVERMPQPDGSLVLI